MGVKMAKRDDEELFLVSMGEGGVSLRSVSLADLAEHAEDEFWGRGDIQGSVDDLTAYEGQILIVGRVVMPRPVQMVTKYEID
jgi:hypothetical protein